MNISDLIDKIMEYASNNPDVILNILFSGAGVAVITAIGAAITSKETGMGNVQEIVANRWKEVLMETDLVPIDVHTPMWLWSRGKFKVEI